LACGFPAGPALAAPFAYAVRGDVDDQLYLIDLATGAATAIGPSGLVTWRPSRSIRAQECCTASTT
jgi:hypothetical protein